MSKKIKAILIIMIYIITSACKSENKDQSHLSELKRLGVTINKNTKAIIEIKDGECINCNQSMVNAFCNYIHDKNIFLLVYSDPNRLDISCLIDKKQSNIIFCEVDNNALPKEKYTSVYLLKDGVTDTFLTFGTTNWQSAIQYTESYLSK